METYTARTPIDLLAIVPHVIGFHPEDSVVLLTVGSSGYGGSRPPVSFHARVDLPVVELEQRSVVRMLREVVARHRADCVGLVIYSDDVAAARLFADLIGPGLQADGVAVVDVLRVDGERFYPADDPEDPGTPYDLSTHPFTAAGVLDGRVVYESRAALRDSLVGTDEDDLGAVAEAATKLVDELGAIGVNGDPRAHALGRTLAGQARWLGERLARAERVGDRIGVSDAARIVVLASFEAVREVVWAPMSRETAPGQVDIWRGLVRRAPADLQAGACGVLAFAAWLAGDGALAWCAIDRCLEADPDDPLAQYVATLVESAVPPSVWAPQPAASPRIFKAFTSLPESG